MTHTRARTIHTVLLAAAAALALPGCSGTHVGESWQCPLAQGSSCASIADADPAVPDATPDATPEAALALRAPLTRSPEPRGSDRTRDASLTDGACRTGCGPFAWVVRWLGIESGAADGADAADTAGATVVASAPAEPPATQTPAETVAEASDLPLPVPATGPDEALREAEVIGRIWIAPFVDGAGVYREGAWVRTVLEPALWRRP